MVRFSERIGKKRARFAAGNGSGRLPTGMIRCAHWQRWRAKQGDLPWRMPPGWQPARPIRRDE